jgi:hypothetical protein
MMTLGTNISIRTIAIFGPSGQFPRRGDRIGIMMNRKGKHRWHLYEDAWNGAFLNHTKRARLVGPAQFYLDIWIYDVYWV